MNRLLCVRPSFRMYISAHTVETETPTRTKDNWTRRSRKLMDLGDDFAEAVGGFEETSCGGSREKASER